ncbi:dimethylarginine dimethylaminohydrolase [Anaeramoeba flamelloides]|uniref:Dimethylarginine dimethylaminohydrolase n=1 Tax=Anaeramoeba flamelloides TaxID=1746091 RepID=A0ABQ8Y4X9_9EUKA|nr:dimethylarginine dimethylaminohydrolase [Anaeramoeba flamelloides]
MENHLLPPIRNILSRKPCRNFASGLTTSNLGPPDYDKAMVQYDKYIESLKNMDLNVKVLCEDESLPDGHFVEDPLIVYKNLVFVCKSGNVGRRGEEDKLLKEFKDFQIVTIEDELAFIDGGDVLFCADRVLVGLSERTNQKGIDALANAIKTVQSDIKVVSVPISGKIHLKSGLTELYPNVLLRDPGLTIDTDLTWATVITLPEEEGYASDVMPINDTIFIVKGYPTVLKAAKKYYQKVVALDMSEFQKMDGGLTCLSLRY